MPAAVLSIDIEARLTRLESGFKEAESRAGKFGDRLRTEFESVKSSSDKFGRDIAEGAKGGANGMEHLSFATAGAKRELLVLFHELSQGNFKKFGGSLLVLGEQTGAASLLFSGLGLAALAAAAGVGVFALAAFKGAEESSELRKSLVLTGNYAGLTADKFNTMAVSIAQSTQAHVGAARDVLQGLVATGQLSGQALGAVSEAATAFQKISGASAEEVVKDFAKMTDGVYKWAEEHNKQYHFLTAAELEHIRRLEEEGDKTNAYIAVATALNEHLKDQNTNVGLLVGTWHAFGNAASKAWDSLKEIGRDRTVGDQIADLQKKLADPLNTVANRGSLYAAERVEQEKRLAFLWRAQGAFEHVVTLQAKKKQDEETLHQDNEFLRKQEEQFRTNAEKRTKEVAEINKKADDAIAKGGEFSAERRAKLIANVEDKYKDRAGPKDDPTKALLANRLKEFEHAISEESEMHAAYNRLADFYFSQNLTSIDTYYEGRKQRDAAGLKLKLAAYEKEIEELRAHQARTGKATERAEDEGKINDLLDKQRKLTIAAAFEGTLGADKQTAAMRSLKEQIEDVNGEIQKLTGNASSGAGAAFDKKYRDLKEKLDSNPNVAGKESVDRLRELQVAQGALNDMNADAALIYEQLRNAEERISISRQLGATSEFGSLRQLGEARQGSVRDLEAILKAQEAIAAASGSPKLVLEAEKARLAYEKLAATTDVLGDHMRTMFEDALSSPLTDFIMGTKSAKDAFKSFATSVLRDIDSIVAKRLAEQLFAKGSPGGDAIVWFGSLFAGAGKSAGATSAAGSAVSVPAEIPNYDTGADRVPRDMLARIHKDERITRAADNNPRALAQKFGNGGTGTTVVNHNYNVTVDGGTVMDRRTALQRGEEIGRGIAAARGRNG